MRDVSTESLFQDDFIRAPSFFNSAGLQPKRQPIDRAQPPRVQTISRSNRVSLTPARGVFGGFWVVRRNRVEVRFVRQLPCFYGFSGKQRERPKLHFQSCALPTELPVHLAGSHRCGIKRCNANRRRAMGTVLSFPATGFKGLDKALKSLILRSSGFRADALDPIADGESRVSF